MSDYHYIDPRGKRSGPYSETEVKFLAERGLLEPEGRIEMAGLASWKVAEVPWLGGGAVAASAAEESAGDAASVRASAGRTRTAPPPAPDHAPPPVPLVESSATTATASVASDLREHPPTDAPRTTTGSHATPRTATVHEPVAACSRAVYVVLALVPPFLGLFGIHHLVAGQFTRGIVMLVFSVFTFGGAWMLLAPPCACIGVPVWIVLFILSVIDAVNTTADARGVPFS
ncbi:MAG: hypothetical protein RL136_20 [Planctomycetota bacterium]|jgi:hypothetical protein